MVRPAAPADLNPFVPHTSAVVSVSGIVLVLAGLAGTALLVIARVLA